MSAEYQPDRLFGGLTNQAWKDSQAAFEYEKGSRAVYPVHDIFSNAATWAALKYCSKILLSYDPKLAGEAERAAVGLKMAT